jgi:hypothetical protein
MASIEFLVTISVHWLEESPDGSACVLCGDRCYLKQYRLWAFIDGRREQRGEWVACDSCKG